MLGPGKMESRRWVGGRAGVGAGVSVGAEAGDELGETCGCERSRSITELLVLASFNGVEIGSCGMVEDCSLGD